MTPDNNNANDKRLYFKKILKGICDKEREETIGDRVMEDLQWLTPVVKLVSFFFLLVLLLY